MRSRVVVLSGSNEVVGHCEAVGAQVFKEDSQGVRPACVDKLFESRPAKHRACFPGVLRQACFATQKKSARSIILVGGVLLVIYVCFCSRPAVAGKVCGPLLRRPVPQSWRSRNGCETGRAAWLHTAWQNPRDLGGGVRVALRKSINKIADGNGAICSAGGRLRQDCICTLRGDAPQPIKKAFDFLGRLYPEPNAPLGDVCRPVDCSAHQVSDHRSQSGVLRDRLTVGHEVRDARNASATGSGFPVGRD